LCNGISRWRLFSLLIAQRPDAGRPRHLKELPVTTLPDTFIDNLIGLDPGAFSETAAPCARPRPQIKIN
jgi:hypothetical protein